MQFVIEVTDDYTYENNYVLRKLLEVMEETTLRAGFKLVRAYVQIDNHINITL